MEIKKEDFEKLNSLLDELQEVGMHEESCRYRGIVGCKACRHYEKGKTCELFKEN